MINELLETLKEDLQEVSEKLKEYENRTYTIENVSSIINDRREYDRLVAEKRVIKLTIYRLKNI